MLDILPPANASWSSVLTQLVAATLLPLMVGMERFLRRKPIDFRPYVIISVVACAIMIGTADYMRGIQDEDATLDPTRVMQGVITGIGFLGAGAMYRDGDFVKGAGSAATIWSAGVIGLLCGIGEVWLAGVITFVILAVMTLGEPLTGRWDNSGDD